MGNKRFISILYKTDTDIHIQQLYKHPHTVLTESPCSTRGAETGPSNWVTVCTTQTGAGVATPCPIEPLGTAATAVITMPTSITGAAL